MGALIHVIVALLACVLVTHARRHSLTIGDGDVAIIDSHSTTSRPVGEHLAFGTIPSTLALAWHTETAVGSASVAWWPANDPSKRSSSVGQSNSYPISPNATAYVHRAIMGPLSPGEYMYTAMHSGGATGTPYRFKFEDASNVDLPVKMLIFGDSGHSTKWHDMTVPAVAAEVASGSVSAIVHTGKQACVPL